MKNMLSKILLGISALVVAGIVSVVPFGRVQAAEKAYPNAIIYVENLATGYRSTINGSLLYTFTGADSADIRNYDFTIAEIPTGITTLNSRLEFNSQIASSGTCNVEFNFTYQNVAYHGVVNLPRNYGNQFITDGSAIIDNYVDTRDLYDVQAFGRAINEKVNEIDMAFNGLNPDGTVNETKTVEYELNGAINEKIIEKLAQAEGVTLLYTFEYEGYVFTSAVTSEAAAQLFSKDIPWYGPCYIASNCPTVMIGVAE